MTKMLVLLVVCFCATCIGSIVGAGGGVIINPVCNFLEIMPSSSISFCSSVTVLFMSVSSLIRTRKNGIRLEKKLIGVFALGSVIGGFMGKGLFELVGKTFGNDRILGLVQSVAITLLTVFVSVYVRFKDKIKSRKITNLPISSIIGLTLGTVSSFLGIGGGTLNVAVLYYLFSMDAKTAAKNSMLIIVFSQSANIITSLITSTVPVFDLKNMISMCLGGVCGAITGSVISKKLNNKNTEKMLQVLNIIIIMLGIFNTIKFTLAR